MSRKAKKAMAVALTAGMLASTAVTPVMAATQGWKQNSKGWWYQNADGSYPANKWSQINGKWYYFDANGYMLANKWVKDKAGKWYFVGANGAMKTNSWAQDSKGLWYWLTDDGSMFEGGWGKINGQWYFFSNDGVMQTGVIQAEDKTGTEKIYYLTDNGNMAVNEAEIDGITYKFDASGAATGDKIPTPTKAFKNDGTPVALNPEERDLTISGATAISKDASGNFVFTVLLNETATTADLKDTELTLSKDSISVTASFVSLSADGATAVYKIDDSSKLTPGDTSANGKYTLSGVGIEIATDVTVAYEETLVGNAIQGIVYYYDKADGKYKGIEGATVTVDSKSVVTDAKGFYTIPAATGAKKVEVTANGYFGKEATTNVSKNYPSSQNVILETYVQEKLYIAGTVYNATDLTKKVGNAKVELQKKNSDGTFVTIADVTTAADGQYLFTNDATKYTSGELTGLATAGAAYDFKTKKNDDKVLSEKDTYQIVVSKDYNYDADNNGNITDDGVNNLFDAYNKQTFAVKMNQTGAATVITDTDITPVKPITDATLLMSWETGITPDNASLTVDFRDQNGTTLLATTNPAISITASTDVKDNKMIDADNLLVSLFGSKNPTIPAGTYALVVTSSQVDTNSNPVCAYNVITVKVDEGGKIEATGQFKKATTGTITTTAPLAKPAAETLYKGLSDGDDVKAINAAAAAADGSMVQVAYNVYQKVDGIDGGKVLVQTKAADQFKASKVNNAVKLAAVSQFSQLEAEQTYVFAPSGDFINADSKEFGNKKDEAGFTKDITAVAAGKIKIIDLSHVEFRDNSGIKLTSQPSQAKLLSVTLKKDGKVVAEANDVKGSYTGTAYASLDDIDPTAVFNDAYKLTHLVPGKYTAEIKIEGFEAFTTEEFDIIDFQEATLSTQKATNEIIETTISGSFMYEDKTNVNEDASIIILDANGIVVAAYKYTGSAGTYSIENDNNPATSTAKIGAGTYTVVVRGAGFETYTKSVKLDANKNNPLDIVVKKHDNGGLVQFAIYDSNGYAYGSANAGKIALYDEYYVDPANTTLDKYNYLDKVFGNAGTNGSANVKDTTNGVAPNFIGKFSVVSESNFAFTTTAADTTGDILSAGTYKIGIGETGTAYGNNSKDSVTISKIDETASKNIVLTSKTAGVSIPVTVNYTGENYDASSSHDNAEWVVIEDLNKNIIDVEYLETTASTTRQAIVHVSKNGTFIVKVYVKGKFVGSQEVVIQDQAKEINIGLTDATRK